MFSRRSTAAALAALAAPRLAAAQSAPPSAWPQARPIEVIVPVPPGGGLDTMARHPDAACLHPSRRRLRNSSSMNRSAAPARRSATRRSSTPRRMATPSAPSPPRRCRRCRLSARSATAPRNSPGSPMWSRIRMPSSSTASSPLTSGSPTSPPRPVAGPAASPTAAPGSAATTISPCSPMRSGAGLPGDGACALPRQRAGDPGAARRAYRPAGRQYQRGRDRIAAVGRIRALSDRRPGSASPRCPTCRPSARQGFDLVGGREPRLRRHAGPAAAGPRPAGSGLRRVRWPSRPSCATPSGRECRCGRWSGRPMRR